MKRLGMIAFILALVLCFVMPASAIKILPYNMPLHDIMSWDKFDETFHVGNPDNEAMSAAWPEDVDYWNYDGDQWKYNLPDGDEFAYYKTVNVNIASTDGEGSTVRGILVTDTVGGALAIHEGIVSHITSAFMTGSWCNAVVGVITYSATGSAGGGMAAPICSEMNMQPAASSGGSYYNVHSYFSVPDAAELIDSTGFNYAFELYELADNASLDFNLYGLFWHIVGLTNATPKIWVDNTLKIQIDTTKWWLPLSEAEGSYTSQYPVVLTNATAIDVDSTVTTEWAYPINVEATLATNKAAHGYAATSSRFTLSGDTDMSGTSFISNIRGEFRIEGNASSTEISSNGLFAGIEGRYYTDNTDGIAVSDGVHCALAAQMLAGEHYVLSATADYCGLAIVDFTHASATIAVTKYSGVLIAGLGGNTIGNALKIGGGITNFLEITDSDAIAGLDSNTDTATDPDGFIRISIGGQPCYLWTYMNKS